MKKSSFKQWYSFNSQEQKKKVTENYFNCFIAVIKQVYSTLNISQYNLALIKTFVL